MVAPYGSSCDWSSDSSFQFLFSHIFLLSFLPGLVIGCLLAFRYHHRVALFVWIVPAAILGYKLVSMRTGMMDNHFAAAYHHYFAGGFRIREFSNYKDMFEMVTTNRDMPRGMDQLRYTAPFYAAIGYCLSSWAAAKFRSPKTRQPKSVAMFYEIVRWLCCSHI